MSKKSQTKKPAVEQTQAVPSTNPSGLTSPSGSIQWKPFLLPALSFLSFLFLFFEIYKPKINDPWNTGLSLCVKANKTQDSLQKQQYLSEGGTILLEQNKRHPYHARVWYNLGYYYFLSAKYDSTISCEIKALEIGSGGIVNGVENQALELLNMALTRQLNAVKFAKDTSLLLIEKATTNSYYNPAIDKFKGQINANAGNYEIALSHLQKFLAIYPNDFIALFSMAVNYYRHGDKELAKEYALKAQKINPDNEGLNNMIRSLE